MIRETDAVSELQREQERLERDHERLEREQERLDREPWDRERLDRERPGRERLTARDVAAAERHGLPSIRTLLRDLREDGMMLLRQEIALAKTEMSEKMQRTTRSAIGIAVGAVLAFAGLVIILIAASTGLAAAFVEWGMSEQVAVWLAPLIVGLVVVGIGYLMIRSGQKTIEQEGVVPEGAVDAMKETKEWAQDKVRR